MSRALYEIWNLNDNLKGYQWAAQLHDYVAYFQTEEKAVKYVESVKINRAEKKSTVS